MGIIPTPARARRRCFKGKLFALENPHTHTREEAINAAGNVSGNATVNVSCV